MIVPGSQLNPKKEMQVCTHLRPSDALAKASFWKELAQPSQNPCSLLLLARGYSGCPNRLLAVSMDLGRDDASSHIAQDKRAGAFCI